MALEASFQHFTVSVSTICSKARADRFEILGAIGGNPRIDHRSEPTHSLFLPRANECLSTVRRHHSSGSQPEPIITVVIGLVLLVLSSTWGSSKSRAIGVSIGRQDPSGDLLRHHAKSLGSLFAPFISLAV
jgi:hypothetical protein